MTILQLDEYLTQSGILDIRKIGSNIVIIAKTSKPQKDNRRFSIKIKETPEEIAEALEIRCDKPLGRKLTQYLIQFVCKPDNWEQLRIKSQSEQHDKELNQFKPKYHFDTFEEWQLRVEKCYHHLHKTVDDNMSAAWPAIEFILSVKAILHVKEITLPFIGIILGPPSGVKTVPLELLRNRNHTFYTDSFNPHAVVSHVATLPDGMKEGDQHMLLKMKNNLVLAPELAPLFAKPEDELREIISILTRIADGRGFESDTGLGHKGVSGQNMFVMGGAAVEIPPQCLQAFNELWPQIVLFQATKDQQDA